MDEKVLQIERLVWQRRGFYLHHAIKLEQIFDYCISVFFSQKDKRLEFINSMLRSNNPTLNSKFLIFRYIYDKSMAKTLSNIGKVNLFLSVIETRNIYAHVKLVSLNSDLTNTVDKSDAIFFEKYSSGKLSPVYFSDEEIKKQDEMLFEAITIATSLFDEIV